MPKGIHPSSRRSVRYVAALAACLVLAAGCQGPWGWGQNNFGQVGDGTTSTRRAPVEKSSSWLHGGRGGAASTSWECARTARCGPGENGSRQLGDGTTTDRLVPQQVGTATNWKTASAGSNHTVALRIDGSLLWAVGTNSGGPAG